MAVEESPRAIPLLAKCEVLVVGGGPSGIAAALGARRAGCDVILVSILPIDNDIKKLERF